MFMNRRCFAAAVLLATAAAGRFPVDAGAQALALAQEAPKIRLGTLAPRGTSWHRSLLEMGEKWRAAQGAGAAFIVYADGTQGGEADMVRRMRIGQLNAALLSVVGLSEIDDSASVLQKMPMVFRSWAELDYLREKLRPTLEKRFFDKGFVVLFWGDSGWVRFFSKEPALHPSDYRRMKVFAWAGDNPQVDIMKSLGFQPVVLETSDILPGLQTGMISVVPSTPIYALVGQFYRPAGYMLDMNWVPIVGAVVITRKVWDTMSSAGQKALREAGEAASVQMRVLSRREDEESIEAMKKRGLKVQSVTPEIEAEWRKTAEQAYPMIRGTMMPADLFDEVQRLLKEYRAKTR
ncbi:MAG: TRAP transporter substrate-binding protein DctP [Burkholderiaceae bacterium]|nr:TRAP transporter substrate-binding protein DctP [Burkholderiaceae bacterium]